MDKILNFHKIAPNFTYSLKFAISLEKEERPTVSTQ